MILSDQRIDNKILIDVKEGSKILGAFDMNKDGSADLIYIDHMNNVTLLI